MDSGPSQCTSRASSQAQVPVESGPSESRLRVNQGCSPMEPTCPAAWTVRLHPGTRVSMLDTSPTSLHPTSVFSHQLNVILKIESRFTSQRFSTFPAVCAHDVTPCLGVVNSVVSEQDVMCCAGSFCPMSGKGLTAFSLMLWQRSIKQFFFIGVFSGNEGLIFSHNNSYGISIKDHSYGLHQIL